MICFCWTGLPQYAARCIGAFVNATDERVVVIATRPVVPILGMENAIPGGVVWVDASETRGIAALCGEMPRAMFVSGWGTPLFNRFRDEVRSEGGRVFAMSDGNAMSLTKTLLRALRFRLLLRGKYDGYLVPGRSGGRLMRCFGVSEELIATGLYAADGAVFHNGAPLVERDKRMIFVGRYCPVKNVLRLCEAFRSSAGPTLGWRLDLYGCGESKSKMFEGGGVFIHDFLQPECLAEHYRKSRVFILPSIVEPWGLVVHEAALSGCYLLLSNRIGAGQDFVGDHNGVFFDPYDVSSMVNCMNVAFKMTSEQLLAAEEESVRLARERAGISVFVQGCKKLLMNRNLERKQQR